MLRCCAAAAAADFYCQDRSVAAREQIEIEFFHALVPSRNIENKCWKMQFNIYTHMRCIIFSAASPVSKPHRERKFNSSISAARCWVPTWFANAGRDPAALLAPLIVELRAWDISTCTRSLWEVNKLELPQNDANRKKQETPSLSQQILILSRHLTAI